MSAPDYLWNGPAKSGLTVLLAHGAGAPMDTPFMEHFAQGIGEAGYRCGRFEFAYMARRRTEGVKPGPDSQAKLLAAWREAIEGAKAERVVIGGKSMGGRMASMIAAEDDVAGLVCLGYPFHAPGKPDKPRVEHLASLRCPAVFLQGTRDSFGSREEVEGYGLPKGIEVHWLEDGDHDLKPRKALGRTTKQNWDEGLDAVISFLRTLER